MKTKHFLLFDLDGTVSNSAPGIMDSIEYALSGMGIASPGRDFLAKFVGPPLRYSFKNYIGLSESDIEKALKLYREHYSEKGIYNNSLFDGTADFLKKAKEEGKTVMLATSKPKVFADRVLEYLKVAQYFDYVSAAGFTPEHNEKWEIIASALKESGAEKSDCVMIGDRIYDVEGAGRNGIPCIGIVNGSPFENELHECGAYKVVKDFYELSDYLL